MKVLLFYEFVDKTPDLQTVKILLHYLIICAQLVKIFMIKMQQLRLVLIFDDNLFFAIFNT